MGDNRAYIFHRMLAGIKESILIKETYAYAMKSWPYRYLKGKAISLGAVICHHLS